MKLAKKLHYLLVLCLFGVFIFFSCTQIYKQDGLSSDVDQYPLLLISIDGFMPGYMDTYNTPALDLLASRGVRAEWMIPVFPTKTFPNHYSIVTGLYTENTGVIANNMYDPEMDAWFSLSNREAVMDARWYGGEPIWVTAEKQGMKAATLFWPGSEAPIGDIRPSRWMPYEGSLPYSARVDTILSWLQLPAETRPGLLTLYFSQVDTYGHRYGPDSDSVRVAVERIDAHLGDLIDGLERMGVWPNIHILITSDHGMAELSEEKVIFLDEIIDLGDVEVIDWTPVAMIQPKDGKTEEIYSALKQAEEHHNFAVYRKEEIPEVYRVKNHPRVPEIMIIADMNYTLTTRRVFEQSGVPAGTHGFDHRTPEMRSFFLASGPALKQNEKTGPFQNIHLYELMAHLLNLEPAPNDGSLDSLKFILR